VLKLRYRKVSYIPWQIAFGELFRIMDLSLNKLSEALALRQQIDTLERRLSALFAGTGSRASSSTAISVTRSRGRRRPMSAATRAKLAAAARARWARQRGGSTLGSVTAGKRRKLSAAGRKRISDAMKARWAARRKGKR
jgi:hypothetical protein